MLNTNSGLKYLLSILTLSSSFVFTGNPTVAQNNFSTTFHCIKAENNLFYTIARRGNRQTDPILKWQNKSWGSKYTPQKRCDIVSNRLTRAVARNGGRLKGLSISYGKLNGYPILCHVRSQRERCSSSNILLTLRQSEFGKEEAILRDMMNFSVSGSGRTVHRGMRGAIKLGEQVENELNKTNVNSTEATPAAPSAPNTTPGVSSPGVSTPSQPVEEDGGF